MKRAYVEIDLGIVAKNIQNIQSKLDYRTKFMAIVKADGYGHGAAEIANVAIANGASYLGVAWVREAAHLRSRGITSPILILSEPTDDLSFDIISLGLTQTVYTYHYAKLLSQAAKKENKVAKIHIKTDTGMNRIGVASVGVIPLIEEILNLDNIEVEGVFTHMPSSDEINDEETIKQIELFDKLRQKIRSKGLPVFWFHMANSLGTVNYPNSHFDMVRIGHDMYAGALCFKSKVAYIHKAPEGETVSYGRDYHIKKETQIATVSVGYADGFPRLLSNCGKVLIKGKAFPIIGKICMDMIMVDIGSDTNIRVGDKVTLIGVDQDQSILIDEIARMAKTIDYEIMCGIGKRVPRIYIS
jgi:alanine racemase